MKKAFLHLANSLEFQGYSFGYEASAAGETVFSTSMVGYPESLTDPTYAGQLLCITYPLIGNYGIQSSDTDNGISQHFESDHIWVKGLIVTDCSFNYSHWSAVESLDEWMKKNQIPGIFGVDTRQLAKVLRDQGTMQGCIVPEGCTVPSLNSKNDENTVQMTGCKEVIRYNEGKGGKRIVLVDLGVKNSILRCFTARNNEIIRVPRNFDYTGMEFDGLIVSNGPGDPDACIEEVQYIQKVMEMNKPIFGIGLGHQLLAKAAGFNTMRLKCGHRGHNQPVRLSGTNQCFITSQNHGFAVDTAKLVNGWEPLFINMNDGTNEGLKHQSGKFFSVQFHPELIEGHSDFDFLFDEFFNLL